MKYGGIATLEVDLGGIRRRNEGESKYTGRNSQRINKTLYLNNNIDLFIFP